VIFIYFIKSGNLTKMFSKANRKNPAYQLFFQTPKQIEERSKNVYISSIFITFIF